MNPTPHAPVTIEPTTAPAQQTAAEQDVCEHAWRACGGRAFAVARINGTAAMGIIKVFATKADADFLALTLNDASPDEDIYEVVPLLVSLERPGPIDWPKGVDANVSNMLHASRLITDTLARAHERPLDERELDAIISEAFVLSHLARCQRAPLRAARIAQHVSSRPAASAAGVPQPASTTRDAGVSGLRAAS